MDQIKIGKFISVCRKNVNLTQAQLAEKLLITDKAISKWERGIAMPDSSIMLELCDILKISVKELLLGEKISMENNNEKNEELLVNLSKEIEQKNKTIWKTMWIVFGVSFFAFLSAMAVVVFLIPEGTWQYVVIIISALLFLIPCFYSLRLEVSVGSYKCKHCGHNIVPTYKQALNAMHLGTTRYLKCPKCNKRSWCKKVINE